jgi:Uma2 family endonuclease
MHNAECPICCFPRDLGIGPFAFRVDRRFHQPAIGMSSAQGKREQRALITGDDLARMPHQEPCELIDGRIVPMSPTNPEHGRIELNIAAAFRAAVRTQHLGLVMVGEVGIFTKRNPDRVRAADVVYISHAEYARRTRRRAYLDVAPELVIEILSPENPHVDIREKVEEYLAIGVRLVLVVDPATRTIVAERADSKGTRYAIGELVPCGDIIPGFELPVSDAFDY